MPKPSSRKETQKMPVSTVSRNQIRETRLDRYRAKSAAMVHKAVGDPEEVRKDGLAAFHSLASARRRANETAPQKDE
jgi:hypothetical protein